MTCAVLLYAAASAGAAEAGASAGYLAVFDDGKTLTGSRVERWDDIRSGPVFAGRRLMDTRNHVRTLHQIVEARTRGADRPVVLLANGDMLPGAVTAFAPAEPALNLPGRLIVRLAAPLCGAEVRQRDRAGKPVAAGDEGIVAIRADAVAGILADGPSPQALPPGALCLSDGRGVTASSLRWSPDGIRALTDEGVVSARLSDIRRFRVPKIDTVGAVLADGALPSGEPDNWIARLTTAGGAVLTYRQRLRESRWQRTGRQDGFVHAVRPAWALTDIRVPESRIVLRDYRRPTEVPLSLMPAETLAQRSFTGFVWPWRVGTNVRGSLLRSGELVSGLGIGTHSLCRLALELPPRARSMHTWVGLDRAVGPGGCVRCSVHADSPSGKRLWVSGVLVGSDRCVRAGPLNVSKARKVVLVTDFAARNVPAGADPADIRDEVDWIMPMVTVDESALAVGVEGVKRHVPCLAGWTIEKPAPAELTLRVARDPSRRLWRVGIDAGKEGLTLKRKVDLADGEIRIDVAVGFLGAEAAKGIEVHADGGATVEGRPGGRGAPVICRQRGEQPVYRWFVKGAPGGSAVVTLRIPAGASKDGGWIVLRGLAVAKADADPPDDGRNAP